MGLDQKGNLDWFAFYYDPLVRSICTFRDDVSAYAAIAITLYVLPQHRAFGTQLYDMAVRKLGWNDPKKPLLQLHPDPRWLALAIFTARELGDTVTETRLRQVAEASFEPKFFGPDGNHFGWFFKFGESWPRGQLSSLMVLSELGEPGAWSRVFNQPNLAKFSEPTVSGVDYPTLGIAQCWNDPNSGTLWVETHCAASSKRGAPTTFQVSGLPNPAAVCMTMDGSEYRGWSISGTDAIEIRSDVDTHQFRIVTGWRGTAQLASRTTAKAPSSTISTTTAANALVSASQHMSSQGSCSCC
jgi:hypothetical protein